MRVLLVEDERTLGDTLARGLRQQGWSVDLARHGLAGLSRAVDREYDVVLLDVVLPRLHGYEVLRELRRRGIATPVVMLSAKDGELDQADALDLGADDYVTKPFSFVLLLARIRAVVRRGPASLPAVLAAGDLTLDPGTHRVARAGVDVALTAREFALLEHLMRHRGQVLSKAQLLAEVWDPAAEPDPNTVEVYVRYLRTKVDLPFGVRSIETLRGVGYRLVDATVPTPVAAAG